MSYYSRLFRENLSLKELRLSFNELEDDHTKVSNLLRELCELAKKNDLCIPHDIQEWWDERAEQIRRDKQIRSFVEQAVSKRLKEEFG